MFECPRGALMDSAAEERLCRVSIVYDDFFKLEK